MKHIKPFWDDEYKKLKYKKMPFNNKYDVIKWREKGYTQDEKYFTGQMCGHNDGLPSWNQIFHNWTIHQHNLKNVGFCYYKMITNEILPIHSDDYKLYRNKFNLDIDDVFRILVFLEDWKSVHYFEFNGEPIVNWKKGDYLKWNGKVPHMAANIGVEPRYTLQITGHL